MRILIPLLLIVTAAPAADAIDQLKKALKCIDALDPEGAEQALTAAIQTEPRLAQAYLARGRLREHMDRPEDAARDFERASRLGGNFWRHAADLYESASAHAEAAHAYQQSYKRSQELADLVALADSRAAGGDLTGALFAYNECLRHVDGTKAVRYLVERGRVRSYLGMFEEGVADVNLAISRVPRYPRAYQIRGRIRLRQGLVKAGLDDYKIALDQLASHASSYWRIGLAYYDTGMWAEAVTSLERCVGFGQGVHDYAHLYLFLARCRTGDPAKRMQASRELMGFLESRPEGDDWFAQLGTFLTGALDEKALLAGAGKGNKHTQRERLCEAHAYIAARYMIARSPDAARQHFRKAMATQVQTFVEYNTADSELRRTFGRRPPRRTIPVLPKSSKR